MSEDSKPTVNQAKFRLLGFTLALAVFVNTLFPQLAKAERKLKFWKPKYSF